MEKDQAIQDKGLYDFDEIIDVVEQLGGLTIYLEESMPSISNLDKRKRKPEHNPSSSLTCHKMSLDFNKYIVYRNKYENYKINKDFFIFFDEQK